MFWKLILIIRRNHTSYAMIIHDFRKTTEIKREMLSKYELLIADFYNISTANVKKVVPNVLGKKYVLYFENLINLILINCIKSILEFNQSQCLKPKIQFSTKERMEAEKYVYKD